ncbi:MAG TPA: hypothetical protein VEF36_11960, partial [Roseiarcus sp.]|nr:hypothetical protein [Roseiarcus sp.]
MTDSGGGVSATGVGQNSKAVRAPTCKPSEQATPQLQPFAIGTRSNLGRDRSRPGRTAAARPPGAGAATSGTSGR